MVTNSFSLSAISDKVSMNTGLCLLRQEQILSSLFFCLGTRVDVGVLDEAFASQASALGS